MPGRLPCGVQAAMFLTSLLGDLALVTLTQRRFEHDADRKREPLEVRQTRLFQRIECDNTCKFRDWSSGYHGH